jgi:hypothetical protein
MEKHGNWFEGEYSACATYQVCHDGGMRALIRTYVECYVPFFEYEAIDPVCLNLESIVFFKCGDVKHGVVNQFQAREVETLDARSRVA